MKLSKGPTLDKIIKEREKRIQLTVDLPDDVIQNITREEVIDRIIGKVCLQKLDVASIGELVQKQIEEQARHWVRKVFSDKRLDLIPLEFQPTTEYGEPRGKSITVRELVAKTFEKTMNTVCDVEGHTFAESVIREYTRELTEKKVKAAVEAVLPKTADTIADVVKDAIRRKLGLKR